MIELLVVLVLVGVLATIAGADLNQLRGRYRMNAAARQFADTVELTRVRAITTNREFAMVLMEFDPTPMDMDIHSNHGKYEIRSGESLRNSTNWDPEPNGTVDLYNGPSKWTGVSIDEWEPINGPANYNFPNALVFSPRGYLINDPSDFSDGVVRVVFRSKASRVPEARVVRIVLGGGTQIAQVE